MNKLMTGILSSIAITSLSFSGAGFANKGGCKASLDSTTECRLCLPYNENNAPECNQQIPGPTLLVTSTLTNESGDSPAVPNVTMWDIKAQYKMVGEKPGNIRHTFDSATVNGLPISVTIDATDEKEFSLCELDINSVRELNAEVTVTFDSEGTECSSILRSVTNRCSDNLDTEEYEGGISVDSAIRAAIANACQPPL